MIFWRIVDNKLYSVGNVDRLGFEESEGLRIPDEYLEAYQKRYFWFIKKGIRVIKIKEYP